MEAKQMIKAELKRREDLVNDSDFRLKAVEIAKAMGITAEEWNKNKMPILLLIANEVCSLQNQLGL